MSEGTTRLERRRLGRRGMDVTVIGCGGLGTSALAATDTDNAAGTLTFRVTELPQRGTLSKNGTPLADNGTFTPADIAFPGAAVILMTAKDAVKCAAFADDRCWCLPVRARIDPALVECVLARVHGRQAA